MSYVYQNDLVPASTDPLEFRSYIEPYSFTNSRFDQSSTVQREDGKYILGVTFYGITSGDGDNPKIRFYLSDDGKTGWTYLSEITSAFVGAYIPNLGIRSDGTIVCVYLENLGSDTTRIIQRTSGNSGVTWGSIEVVRENSGEYLQLPAHPIFVCNNGDWVVCYDILTSGSPALRS